MRQHEQFMHLSELTQYFILMWIYEISLFTQRGMRKLTLFAMKCILQHEIKY